MSRILVVEDEPDIALGLEVDLTSHGYEVETVRDGESASRRGREPGWDLILLDLMLPRKDGYDVCQQLRQAGVRTPIIMLTARTHEAEKIMGLDLGADDYVTKPFSLRELTARIRALLRRTEQPLSDAPTTVGLGDLTVDLAGHRLLRDGHAVQMKPKVFELLAFLVEHPGQVFSRERLLEQVWGYDFAGETRTVDVHVHWLRTAIEPDPAAPTLIQTVRGVGYVLRRPA